ncbi:Hypothetical_protein [Hexamita inflata]|uniref:Hypothetical_protein n=1 Tax=Hexamita inflata TaxID=28002 RepID=A0AA86PKK7_9EUKA|nr:Hypothetical protein HINF_LOCUS29029 [Hexamita inflata]
MFIYTENTKQSNLQIEMFQVNQFAVFGFNLNTQEITDSHIYVKINYTVLTGALVCLECDISVKNSSLIFIASGLTLSALILKSKEVIQLNNVDIQFRLDCNYSSGIVNLINSLLTKFIIQDCNLSGYNKYNTQSGYLCSKLSVDTQINLSSFTVCVNDNMQMVGVLEQQLNISGAELITCQSICSQDKYITFGICLQLLNYSRLVNYTQQCLEHFVFDFFSNLCLCGNGFYLNGSSCVNVSTEFSQIIVNMQLIDDKLHNEIQGSNLEFKSLFYNLETDIQSNITNLYNLVTETYINLKEDIRTQNVSIHNDLMDLKINMDSKFQLNIDQNTETQLKISDLSTYISNIIKSLNNNLSQIINENQVQIKNNFTVADQKLENVILNMNYLLAVSLSNFTKISNQISGLDSMNQSFITVLDTCSKENTLNNQADMIKTQIDQLSDKIDHISAGGCPQNSNLVNGACSCSISGQILVGGICVCFASGTSVISGVCTCPVGQQMIDDICQTVVIYNGTNTDNTLQCSSSIYITTFDIQTITSQITSENNFSRGYVFGANIIQNGYIDIADNIYTYVYSLFQFQNSFTNIKIQIGKQNIQMIGGSLLTPLTKVIINQMNIISRESSQITINSQFILIAGVLTNSSINNLLVNLSLTLSTGQLTLASAINQQFQLTGYQVLGTYQSTSTISMICFDIGQATIYINQVSFKPSVYNVGNSSSYFICGLSSINTVTMNNIAIIIGNDTNIQMMGQQMTTNFSFPYQFGGIIANINSGFSVTTINNVILDCYQKINTTSVQNSGILVGKSYSNNYIIRNLCLQQNTNTNSEIKNFGFIGFHQNGNISIQQVYINLFFKGSVLYDCGLIGSVYFSVFCEIVNTKTSFVIPISSGHTIGCIIGYMQLDRIVIQNSTVINSSLLSNWSIVGGFIGYAQQQCSTCNIEYLICNSTIKQSNISLAGSLMGGFIGQNEASKLRITNSQIQSTRICGSSLFGLIQGNNNATTFIFVNCSSSSNYINNVLKTDCAVIVNYLNGC